MTYPKSHSKLRPEPVRDFFLPSLPSLLHPLDPMWKSRSRTASLSQKARQTLEVSEPGEVWPGAGAG